MVKKKTKNKLRTNLTQKPALSQTGRVQSKTQVLAQSTPWHMSPQLQCTSSRLECVLMDSKRAPISQHTQINYSSKGAEQGFQFKL